MHSNSILLQTHTSLWELTEQALLSYEIKYVPEDVQREAASAIEGTNVWIAARPTNGSLEYELNKHGRRRRKKKVPGERNIGCS